MVIADFSGNFVNAENTKEGDVLVIVGEGDYEEKESRKGDKYTVLNLPVDNGEKTLVYSPGRDAGKELVRAWGRETKDWISKKCKAYKVHYMSYGEKKESIELAPLEDEKA